MGKKIVLKKEKYKDILKGFACYKRAVIFGLALVAIVVIGIFLLLNRMHAKAAGYITPTIEIQVEKEKPLTIVYKIQNVTSQKSWSGEKDTKEFVEQFRQIVNNEAGQYVVTYHFIDNQGNRSPEMSREFMIELLDSAAPTIDETWIRELETRGA